MVKWRSSQSTRTPPYCHCPPRSCCSRTRPRKISWTTPVLQHTDSHHWQSGFPDANGRAGDNHGTTKWILPAGDHKWRTLQSHLTQRSRFGRARTNSTRTKLIPMDGDHLNLFLHAILGPRQKSKTLSNEDIQRRPHLEVPKKYQE